MFVRRNKNRSGSVSIQIVSKTGGRYRVIKTVGSSNKSDEIEQLWHQALHEIKLLQGQIGLFVSEQDAAVSAFLGSLSNAQVSVAGPELVLGVIFDKIGFRQVVQDEMFRHLVISRLVYPGSKLKMIDYLQRYQGVSLSVDSVYRFLDRLNEQYKEAVERQAFEHTKNLLGGHVGVVFYDMTTLYFEASDEDDLRKTGFSKDGRAQNPQILLGLLVGQSGYPIGYAIFEGNTFEGHTLIKVLEGFQKRFDLGKPTVVADAGLLSKENIASLVAGGYDYILGARLKNESQAMRQQITALSLHDGQHNELKQTDERRLIVSYSSARAGKDKHNRERGLRSLEAKVKSGKLTKGHINNRGYNKYLRIEGEVNIQIDYEKYESDNQWDGLKGYLTNSKLPAATVLEHYQNLWQIEKAFRISKTDLQIRPIYHRLRHRIEAHICVCFTAYTIYKELERLMQAAGAPFSVLRAIDLTLTMYQLTVQLPESRRNTKILLKLTEEQQWLMNFIQKSV